jgi:glycosyltransferase involved in cell wall biosynthesis
MAKVIHLLCNDGSPLGITPPDIDGRGVGGAELAMMTLMRTLAERGHTVTVYNDPAAVGEYQGVNYLPRTRYRNREPRDVLIIFRSPNPMFQRDQMPPEVKKIWWSCDQFTIGDFGIFSNLVDFVVTISPYHTNYHHERYHIPLTKMGHIDCGVRLEEYQESEIQRIPGRLIYCSIPDRGLTVLHAAWALIKRDVPEASLVITSDYTLWGAAPNNQNHRLMWARADGVSFLGKVPRRQLIKLQRQAEILAYPSIYEEMFCISAAECQVAGALPVTSGVGALPTTNEFGIIIAGSPKMPAFVNQFASRIVGLLTREHEYLVERRKAAMAGAARRFDWNVIAERWEKLFEEGKL